MAFIGTGSSYYFVRKLYQKFSLKTRTRLFLELRLFIIVVDARTHDDILDFFDDEPVVPCCPGDQSPSALSLVHFQIPQGRDISCANAFSAFQVKLSFG